MAAAAAGEAADEGGQMSEYVVSVSAVLETTGVDIPAAAKSEVYNDSVKSWHNIGAFSLLKAPISAFTCV